MKLVIQIPCFNEEQSLPEALRALPRHVEGFDRVLWQVIDDGSIDRTVEVAKTHGVDLLVRMNGNQGLARAFMAGLESAVRNGADVIVHTDADNQYDARDIPALVAPILAGKADLVVGARPIPVIRHFSLAKRILQRLGSAVVRSLSRTPVDDAPSGFRAMTRDTALRLNVFNSFSYTLETIIQAGRSNLRVASVPIRVNGPTRPSRLARSTLHYILRSTLAIVGAYVIYRPVKVFTVLAALLLLPAAALAGRYVIYRWTGEGAGHVQSVIASGVLAVTGVLMGAMGVVAHLLGINRRLLEELRYLAKAGELTGVARTLASNARPSVLEVKTRARTVAAAEEARAMSAVERTPLRSGTALPTGFVPGNHFDKYRSANPVHRWMMRGFLRSARGLVARAGARRILEVGCGPGDLAAGLFDGPDAWRGPDGRGIEYVGTDISKEEILTAKRQSPRRDFRIASAYELPFTDGAFDLVIACEVMEHLEEPARAMSEVARVCRSGGHALVSVPWEPTWRALNFCRGKYIGAWGNTPGHLQHFSRRALRTLVGARMEIIETRKPFPWSMVLARRN